MKLQVNNPNPSVYELTVTVDQKSWHAAQQKAIEKLSENVSIKGFRKGKAPRDLVRKQLDDAKILQEGVSVILNDAYSFALTESKVTPFLQPAYNVSKISDTELEIVFNVVSAPALELGAYKGRKIGHEVADVSDEDVGAKMNTYLERGAALVLKEGEAALGDTVIIDFEGFVDDVAFEGGKASNHELELGSGQFIPGFEQELVGAVAGEKRDVNVTFPDNYTEELKGKKAIFKTVVHEVKTKVLPELDDKFAADLNLPNVSDVASLRIHARYELTEEKEKEARNVYIEKLLEAIRKDTKFTIAEEIVHQEGHRLLDNFVKQLEQQGMDFAGYLEATNQKESDLHDKYVEDARLNIENFLVLDEIAKAENIEVSDADVDFEIAKMAQMYNMEEARIREILGENLNGMKNEIRQKRTLDILFEQNE